MICTDVTVTIRCDHVRGQDELGDVLCTARVIARDTSREDALRSAETGARETGWSLHGVHLCPIHRPGGTADV